MTVPGYDLIGDVHGCAASLRALLDKLGYRWVGGVFRHPERKTIFLGDIIDRGPAIREALHLVKAMVDAGQAEIVLGNHEYNALLYYQSVRALSPGQYATLKGTLDAFAGREAEWQYFREWFAQLPVYLDRDDFRVVHACWDPALARAFHRLNGPAAVPTREFIRRAMAPGSPEHRVITALLKGVTLALPEGVTIEGSDGVVRNRFRTKFWAQAPRTYGDLVFQPDRLPDWLMDEPLSAAEKRQLHYYGPEEKPLFVGHYWLQGSPRAIRPNIACLDYSAVSGGRLVCYRMDAESRLRDDKFVSVCIPDGALHRSGA